MNLSENFTLAELAKSSTALRLGINNAPNPSEINFLRQLANNILQPVRDEHGSYAINSGFRCLELNRVIGSKDTSQHVKGQAADFEITSLDNHYLATWISENLEFDQLILEFYNGEPSSGWVHCSYVEGHNRNECLTISRGSVKPGLVE